MQEAVGVVEMEGVTAEMACNRFSDEGWAGISVHVPLERELTVYVNFRELVTILCTPVKLNYLVLGFLYAEGIISGMGDVVMVRVCDEESEVDVRLSNPELELPTKRRLTSGCGGGASFTTQARRVDSTFAVTPATVRSLLKQFQKQVELSQAVSGMHASALADTENLLAVAGDIGRHNTLDKIQGECLLRGLATRDRLVLTTGRVSSEMLLKVAKMQAPIVVSRHSPTESAVSLARDLGVALVGHARGNRLLVYSHPERLGCSIN
jgi:FdhD protein